MLANKLSDMIWRLVCLESLELGTAHKTPYYLLEIFAPITRCPPPATFSNLGLNVFPSCLAEEVLSPEVIFPQFLDGRTQQTYALCDSY